ncbi:MAG: hypothetical protein ACE5H3_01900, partial [Planctomycetota bacterium]
EALRLRPKQARRRLVEHARYLERFQDAREGDGEEHQKLVEQEVIGGKVQITFQHFLETLEGSPEREAMRSELRSQLETWFDLRQELRSLQVRKMTMKLDQQRNELEAAVQDPAGLQRNWLERITRGEAGPADGMEEEDPRSEIEALAPALIQAISRHDPEMAEELEGMARESEEQFLETLRRISQQSPRLVEEARSLLDPREEKWKEQLHAALEEARRRIGPVVDRDGNVSVPSERIGELEPVLQALAEAEVELTRVHLERIGRELEKQRGILGFRLRNKDLLVDLQLARMTGDEERYEW